MGMNTREPVLELREVCKSFGDNQILKSIDLTVGRGEFVFIIGPSGSGKSTLLRCCNRLEEPDSGTILVEGKNLMDPATNINLMRQRVGMVFQQFNLYPHLRVLGNITLALRRVRKQSAKHAEEIAMKALNKVGLAHKATAYPGELSGGQQQRVAIARALSLEPSVMLFDEPTSALDPELVKEVLMVMRDLRETGVTMVVVSHEMKFARDVADRIVFMEGGVISEQGSPQEILARGVESRACRFMTEAL